MRLSQLFNSSEKNFGAITAAIFFMAIVVLFTFPVSEGDFFWHVKTGQWIWEHKSLPSVDPFSNVSEYINQTGHVAERTRFLLKQYWLGQLALFGIWKATGETGIVVLRAAIYTGILAFMYLWLRRERDGIIPLATVFIVGNVLRNYAGERPQIFAFLFMVFLLYLLERLTSRGINSQKLHAALLVIVMLAWSNCHGSFILGIIVIVLYGVAHLLTVLSRGDVPNRTLLAVLSLAIITTLANPNGFAAFKEVFKVDKAYTNSIAEYTSPLTELFVQHIPDYYYWILLLAVIITIAFKFRSMALQHILVPLSLAALSLTALRYIPFFILAAPLAVIYLPDWKSRRIALLSLPVLLVWLGTTDYTNTLKFHAARTFPRNAIRFLNTAKPSGNIFNYVFWGGYLMCYTDYPVFVDGRGLAEDFTHLHNQVLAGWDWKKPLSYFQINTIIIPGMSQTDTQPFPVLMQLQQDDEWSLIYQDDVALIFLRNIPQNRSLLERYSISKDRIATHIIQRLEWQLKNEI